MKNRPNETSSWTTQVLQATGLAAVGIGLLMLILSLVPLGSAGRFVGHFPIIPEVILIVLLVGEGIFWFTFCRRRTSFSQSQGLLMSTHVIQILGYVSCWQYLVNPTSFSFLELVGFPKIVVAFLLLGTYLGLNLFHLIVFETSWHDLLISIFSFVTVVLFADSRILQGYVMILVLAWGFVNLIVILSWRWLTRYWITFVQVISSSLLLLAPQLRSYLPFLLPISLTYLVAFFLVAFKMQKITSLFVNPRLFSSSKQVEMGIIMCGMLPLPFVIGLKDQVFSMELAIILILVMIMPFLVGFSLRIIVPSIETLIGFIGVSGSWYILEIVVFGQSFPVESTFFVFSFFLVLLIHSWKLSSPHLPASTIVTRLQNPAHWMFLAWGYLYLILAMNVRQEWYFLGIVFIYGGLLLFLSFFRSTAQEMDSPLIMVFPSVAWILQISLFPPTINALLLHHSSIIMFLVILLVQSWFLKRLVKRSVTNGKKPKDLVELWRDLNVLSVSVSLLFSLFLMPAIWLYPLVTSVVSLVFLLGARLVRVIKRTGLFWHVSLLLFFSILAFTLVLGSDNIDSDVAVILIALGLIVVSVDRKMNMKVMVSRRSVKTISQESSFLAFFQSRLSMDDVHLMVLFLSLATFLSVNWHWMIQIIVFVGLPLLWLFIRFSHRDIQPDDEIRSFAIFLSALFPLYYYFLGISGDLHLISPEMRAAIFLLSWFIMAILSIFFEKGKNGKKLQFDQGFFVSSLYMLSLAFLIQLKAMSIQLASLLSFVILLGMLSSDLLDRDRFSPFDYLLFHFSTVLAVTSALMSITHPNDALFLVVAFFVMLLLVGMVVLVRTFGPLIPPDVTNITTARSINLSFISYLFIILAVPLGLSILARIDLIIAAMAFIIISGLIFFTSMVSFIMNRKSESKNRILQLLGLMMAFVSLLILVLKTLDVHGVFFIDWDRLVIVLILAYLFMLAFAIIIDLTLISPRIDEVMVHILASILFITSLNLLLAQSWMLLFDENVLSITTFLLPFLLIGSLIVFSFLIPSFHERYYLFDGMLGGSSFLLIIGLLLHAREPIYTLMSSVAAVLLFLHVQLQMKAERPALTSMKMTLVVVIVIGIVLFLELMDVVVTNEFSVELAASFLIWGLLTLTIGNSWGSLLLFWLKHLRKASISRSSEHSKASPPEDLKEQDASVIVDETQQDNGEVRILITEDIILFCPNCNRQLRVMGRFCIYCGYRLRE